MRLQEACVRFNKLAGIRFEELFSAYCGANRPGLRSKTAAFRF